MLSYIQLIPYSINDGILYGFEFKSGKKVSKVPAGWLKAYPNSEFECINKNNYFAFVNLLAILFQVDAFVMLANFTFKEHFEVIAKIPVLPKIDRIAIVIN